MIDHGYRKALYSKSDKELIRMIEKENNQYHKEAILDAQNILFERGITFDALFPDEINTGKEKMELSHKDGSLWKFAFEKKKEGLSYTQLLSKLTEKGVSAHEAVLTLKRLPELDYISEDFEALITKEYKNLLTGNKWVCIIFSLILFAILFTKNSLHFAIPAVLLGTIIYSIVSTSNKTGGFIGSQYWINLIKTHPEEIVWVKPIVEKTTAVVIITLSKTKKYQIITKKDKKLEIIWRTDADHEIFIDGVKKYFPHAQFGYSNAISINYNKGPEKFIDNLKSNSLYTPIDSFQL